MSNLGFWKKVKDDASRHGGILALAPMADVTDAAFRSLILKCGRPDVFWTEFVSADGLSHPVAKEKLLIDLKYSSGEHPIVAQIFGGKPHNIRTAALLCKELGFDGIDINMGCPDRAVEKQCAGAGLIKDPMQAKEIIRAAKAAGLPVSVKTRIGYNQNEIKTWIRLLLEEDLAALTVHLRTRKEMSDVPAHWDLMGDIVALRDELGKDTLILGNGDVTTVADAQEKLKTFGGDGAMLGRAIFGNPFLFSEEKRSLSVEARLEVMIEHTRLFEDMLGQHKNFAIMKKHYKAYVEGFPGAKELRMALMEAADAGEVEKIALEFMKNKL